MGGLFSSPKPPPMPVMPVITAPPPPAPIPEPPAPVLEPDDEVLRKERTKKLQQQAARSGRESTILTTDGTLGGG